MRRSDMDKFDNIPEETPQQFPRAGLDRPELVTLREIKRKEISLGKRKPVPFLMTSYN